MLAAIKLNQRCKAAEMVQRFGAKLHRQKSLHEQSPNSCGPKMSVRIERETLVNSHVLPDPIQQCWLLAAINLQ